MCDLLFGTEVEGRPASFYRKESIANWCKRLSISHPDQSSIEFENAYLNAIKGAGQTQNGLFGLRLMHESLDELTGKLELVFPHIKNDIPLLEEAFGQTLFVHLTRNDKISQAISRLRAEQSGLWHVRKDGGARERLGPGSPIAYSRERIAVYEAELLANDAAWERWFFENGICPIG